MCLVNSLIGTVDFLCRCAVIPQVKKFLFGVK